MLVAGLYAGFTQQGGGSVGVRVAWAAGGGACVSGARIAVLFLVTRSFRLSLWWLGGGLIVSFQLPDSLMLNNLLAAEPSSPELCHLTASSEHWLHA